MIRKSLAFRALAQSALILLIATAPALLAGCGSDATTSPVTPPSVVGYDQPGEVPLPDPDPVHKFPVPTNVTARVLSCKCIQLNWAVPAIGYTAMISRDGELIGSVNARNGSFFDEAEHTTEIHTYSICFGKCNSIGQEVSIQVAIQRDALPKPPGDLPIEG